MQTRIPQLDALRGIAILAVMLHNSQKFPNLFRNGWMGVDLFFVLSGLLITGILLDAKESKDYFKAFYARRCLRIWPLYYSLLLFMFVVVPHLRPSEAHKIFESRSSPWWGYPLFLQNFLVPVPTSATGPLAVTWSLAIEEQFYLVWPLVIRYASAAQVRRIAFAVIFASPALRYYLSLRGFDIYPNTFCRMDALMAGALIALLVRSRTFVPSRLLNLAWIGLLVATPLAFLCTNLNANWIAFSMTAAASASLAYLAMYSQQNWLQTALNNRVLVYTGTISYGLYLLHKLPLDAAQTFHLDRHPLLELPVAIVASYVLAFLSWNFLEKPFLRLKRRFAAKPGPAPQSVSI